MNILKALADPKLFAAHFPGDTWEPWRAFLAALFGLPVDDEQRELIRSCTGRDDLPDSPFSEAWLVCGRRGGKSRIMALLAVYLATFKDWRPHLAAGEVGTVMVIAADRKQARTIMRYAVGFLDETPMLRSLVVNKSAEAVELVNRAMIEVHTALSTSTRGYTVVAALLDEIAFWPSGEAAADPDEEILTALRPAMATVPGALLIGASSPYARRGVLYRQHREHHGKAGAPALVWQAATRTMNPAVPSAFVARELQRDPAKARAEYLALFRDDIEGFISREQIDALVEPGLRSRPFITGITYSAFVDPSGGAADAMTLGIAHLEGERRVLDCLAEVKPPFSPEAVVKDFAALLKVYGVAMVTGDRYGGEWPRERFRVHGIEYLVADKPRSDLYRELLPLLMSGTVDLLDDPRMLAQLAALERRKGRGGRDTIDHPPGGHDDVANAVAGALVGALQPRPFFYAALVEASPFASRGILTEHW